MGEGTRRGALRVGLAAVAVALGLPAPAAAIAPGGPTELARPTVDRSLGGSAVAAVPARVREARASLRRRFGPELVLGVDPGSGTTRVVQRLDGALSAPAAGDRTDVARRWVRENRAVLGLDLAAVDALSVAGRETTGGSGISTVRFAQRFDGIEVHDGGLEVALDRGGRVLAAVGEPVTDPGPVQPPRLDAAAARRQLAAGVGPTRALRPAALTLFPVGPETRLAWRLLERRSSTATYAAVVDARTGELLLRQNLTTSAAAVFPDHPGAEDHPDTGPANAVREVDLEAAGYLPAGATQLSGPFARAFADLDDDDVADPGEDVGPGPDGFRYPFVRSAAACPATPGAPTPKCTWDPTSPESWRDNVAQNAVQAFALVNRFHDHLLRPEIGFGAGATGFAGDDPVVLNTRDGAALQDAAHRNNANMTVLPEGLSPRMQMYLFSGPRYRAIDGGDDAATVFHEYSHGLSGRLITHTDGTSALASVHAGALGEGWSDFLALDLLYRDGQRIDDEATPGQVDIGRYSDAVPRATRAQGADCPVGADAAACPGSGGAGPGGFTLGDLGSVADGTQVHADGEIWLETLWDLRRALIQALGSQAAGSDAVERLVADGMRLSPPEPSFLDARNAILAADTAAGGVHRDLLWRVFAQRGMGFFAAVRDANDPAPVEDFSLPPGPGAPAGTVTGRVTDAAGGLDLGGVRVAPTGEGPATTSDATGRYALGLPAGPYARLTFRGPPGYDPDSGPVQVPAGGSVALDRALRRDWASAAGGAVLAEGPGGPCGAAQAIDEVEGSGWSADRTRSARPSLTVVLPTAIDVTAVGIDPAATCGDGPAAALRQYSVQAVRSGGDVPLLGGTFTAADEGRLNLRVPTANARGVTRLRLTLLGSRGPSDFVGVAALSVYGNRSDGAPRGALQATPQSVSPGEAVRFDASSFTDPDSLIESYGWDFDGDGAVDRRTQEPTTSHAYPAAGSPEASVTVRDVGGAEGRASAVVRVTPPPPPPVIPPGVQPRVVLRAPAPTLRLTTTGRRSAAVLVRCASHCRVRATGTVNAPTARRLRRTGRTVVSATRSTTTATLTAPVSRATLRFPVSPATLAAARRRRVRTLVVTLSVRATDLGGRTTTRRGVVRLTL